MRKPLDIDDVEELESCARSPEEHRTAADILIDWAAERHPDDDEAVAPANLPVYAGEQLSMAGDHEEALAVFRQALAAEREPITGGAQAIRVGNPVAPVVRESDLRYPGMPMR